MFMLCCISDHVIVTSLLIRSANTQHGPLDRPYELNNSNLPVVAGKKRGTSFMLKISSALLQEFFVSDDTCSYNM